MITTATASTDLDDVQAFLDGVNGLAAVKEGYDLTADGVVDTRRCAEAV